MSEQQAIPSPESAAGQALHQQVSPTRWAQIVQKAQAQARIVDEVRALHRSQGISLSKALRLVSPTTPWPTFQYWSGRVEDDREVSWEKLLDRRVPPRPKTIPKTVRSSAISLRHAKPGMECEEAREHLVRQHGEAGRISDSSLFRIWQDADLLQEMQVEQEDEQQFHGGAGLALIGAAADETGVMVALAEAARAEAFNTVDRVAKLNLEIPPEPVGRDEMGRLTKAYNEAARAGTADGEQDARWGPDYVKRQKRALERLQVLKHQPHTWSMKLFVIGLIPLITGRRGFDGLDGPLGEWLGVLGGVAYMPATLDKFLAQMAFLDVEDALWQAHAEFSREMAVRWAAAKGVPAWMALIMYIDATQDSYWTTKYAKSGPVSRTGRVGPCLSRITITAGPGVPLLMETYSGSVSLKTELPRVLERVDGLIGEGELGRLTVIDAEMATGKLLYALSADPRRAFITVLKGRNIARDFKPTGTGEWQQYRERDQIRDGEVVVHGEGVPECGVKLRAVEMRREGRHSQSTYFGTGGCGAASREPSEVVDAYLSRWPNQEHLFRNARNGLGLDKTHGYGGEMIHHVAIETKEEEAENRCRRAQERIANAEVAVHAVKRLAKEINETGTDNAAFLVKAAKAELRSAKSSRQSADRELAEIKSTPREIYQRDSARENVVTSLTMTVLVLIEYVLREFFGGSPMELRTFIEHFVNLPVTMVTTNSEVRYRVHINTRNSDRAQQMRRGCEEVTRRRIRRGSKILVFEAVDPERKRVTVLQI